MIMIERLERICERLVLKMYFGITSPNEHKRGMELYNKIQMLIDQMQEVPYERI